MTALRVPVRGSSSGPFVLLAAFVLVGAWLVYRPDRPGPTEIWDFVDFLPRLASEESLWGKIVETIALYVPDGRTNLTFYAFIAANERLFEASSVGWSLCRWSLMVVAMLLSARLVLRGGLAVRSAVVVVSVWMFHGATATAWIMLMAEPLVMNVVLLLLLGELSWERDLGANDSRNWLPLFVGTLLLLTLKETAVALLPVVILFRPLHALQAGGGAHYAAADALRRHLATLVAVVVVATGIFLARASARPSGYGLSYGELGGAVERGARLWLTGILPTRPGAALSWALVAPANAIWMVLVLGGVWLALRRGVRLERIAAVAGIGLLPVTGLAAIYSLWPAPQSYYMMPGALGSAFILGVAFQEWTRAGRYRSAAALGLTALLVAFQMIQADFLTKGMRARASLYASTAEVLPTLHGIDTVVVAYPGKGPGHSLDADHLRRYATDVLRLELPSGLAFTDEDCPTAGSLARRRPPATAVVSFAHGCGRLPQPTKLVAVNASYIDWLTLSWVTGTSAATFILP